MHHAGHPHMLRAMVEKRAPTDLSALLCSPQLVHDMVRTSVRPWFWESTSWPEAFVLYCQSLTAAWDKPRAFAILDPPLLMAGPSSGQHRAVITAPPRSLPPVDTQMAIVLCPDPRLGLGNVVNTIVSAMWLAHHMLLPVKVYLSTSSERPAGFAGLFDDTWHRDLPSWCLVPSVEMKDVTERERQHLLVSEGYDSSERALPVWRHFSMAKAQVPAMVSHQGNLRAARHSSTELRQLGAILQFGLQTPSSRGERGQGVHVSEAGDSWQSRVAWLSCASR